MKIINDFNIKKQAEELGVAVWQTPSFLFLMMGIIILIAMTATYYISRNYDNPEIVVIAESVVVVTILTIGNSIVREVEQIAKLNKMKSEFVSVASHQLRTPLAAMKWETEFLLSKLSAGLTEKQKEGIETISFLSARMARLVNDLLDVARIDQGRLILKKEAVDLVKIIAEAIKNILPLAEAKNISIVFDSSKKFSPVLGDQERLKLAVENLLSNAVKYTLSEGKIIISLEERSGLLIFAIKDNGVGIPEKQQSQVFDKFFRSDNAARFQTEGTGLGLYIAKNIVDQLGGKMRFTSKEGVGSTFGFSLPAAGGIN